MQKRTIYSVFQEFYLKYQSSGTFSVNRKYSEAVRTRRQQAVVVASLFRIHIVSINKLSLPFLVLNVLLITAKLCLNIVIMFWNNKICFYYKNWLGVFLKIVCRLTGYLARRRLIGLLINLKITSAFMFTSWRSLLFLNYISVCHTCKYLYILMRAWAK